MASGTHRRSALPADIRTAWRRLGDPAALSLPVALIYLPFAFTGPLFIDTVRVGGSFAAWFVVGLVGWLTVLAVLLAIRWLIRPLRRGRPVATVIAIALSVAARAVALTLTAQLVGLTPSTEFAYRLNAAIFTQSALLIASAIVVSSYVNHGRLAADLLSRQDRLTQLSSESRKRLELLRSQITDEVRRAVEPLIVQLDDLSKRSEGAGDGLQSAIRQIVDQELRPLSHRLAEAASFQESDDASTKQAKSSRPPLPSRVSLGLLFRPLPSALLAALLASSQAFRAANLIDGLVFTVALSASLGFAVALLRRTCIRIELPVWTAVSAVTVAVAVVFALIVTVWQRAGLPMPPDLQWAALYSGSFIGVLLALEYVVNERRAATEEQLRSSIEELQAQSSMLRQHEYIASRQLSYVVHGSVQASLNAAAMRLSLADHLDRELVQTIRSDIEEAITRIDSSGSAYVMLVQTLADLVDLWEGTAEVTWTMNHQTVRVLAESPPTAASVGEIVTECTSNAIRHGRASHVSVSVSTIGDSIEVIVSDDGSGMPSLVEPRLGTRMLDELCLIWERTSSVAGTTVVARLATERTALLTL